jgi:hypothetical protein
VLGQHAAAAGSADRLRHLGMRDAIPYDRCGLQRSAKRQHLPSNLEGARDVPVVLRQVARPVAGELDVAQLEIAPLGAARGPPFVEPEDHPALRDEAHEIAVLQPTAGSQKRPQCLHHHPVAESPPGAWIQNRKNSFPGRSWSTPGLQTPSLASNRDWAAQEPEHQQPQGTVRRGRAHETQTVEGRLANGVGQRVRVQSIRAAQERPAQGLVTWLGGPFRKPVQ